MSLQSLFESQKQFNIDYEESVEFQFENWSMIERTGSDYSGINDNKLSKSEAFPIVWYTTRGFNFINEDLRNNKLSNLRNDKNLYSKILQECLNKVSSMNNAIVYRMDTSYANNDEDIKDWFRLNIGKTIKTNHFLSTSKEDWEQDEKITWEIKTLPLNSKGKDISNISDNAEELEVLFKRNTVFRIKNVSEKYIHLEELSQRKADILLFGNYWESIDTQNTDIEDEGFMSYYHNLQKRNKSL
jgi:hypothetical protein